MICVIKKFVFFVGFSILLFFGGSFALSIQDLNVSNLNTLIDKKVAKKETQEDKIQFLKLVVNLLADSTFTQSEFSFLFQQVQNHCEYLFQGLSSEKQPIEYLQIDKVDMDKVRKTVLSRHNEERKNVGLSPYHYQSLFEKSATLWSNTIVNDGRSSNFHKRKSTDGYYNYQSIMQWFENLGITFRTLTGGRTAFTESVGYGYYHCTKNDCTDELISAIKTTWDGLIMPEKKSNGSHYRAVVMNYFEEMGIGITLKPSQKRYYLVMHYGITPNEG